MTTTPIPAPLSAVESLRADLATLVHPDDATGVGVNPRDLRYALDLLTAMDEIIAGLTKRLAANERSACGMAEQANIERRRAETAESRITVLEEAVAALPEAICEMSPLQWCQAQYVLQANDWELAWSALRKKLWASLSPPTQVTTMEGT